MYDVSAQGIDERAINVHYYYYLHNYQGPNVQEANSAPPPPPPNHVYLVNYGDDTEKNRMHKAENNGIVCLAWSCLKL